MVKLTQCRHIHDRKETQVQSHGKVCGSEVTDEEARDVHLTGAHDAHDEDTAVTQ